eukprot:CAMPEP_0197521726 /NCGR_PEP_ID=MMETSP1318-20131121/6966_1 /TAXON_ID=552666 /ORGANISM="Partenskyella glossopodia, Strain RCC365" /LENGTH=338 /DNA_ID=CAMNT_0043073833 /DNA_START=680 /DNA_END=1693 /DNA_ORIENTATION=-
MQGSVGQPTASGITQSKDWAEGRAFSDFWENIDGETKPPSSFRSWEIQIAPSTSQNTTPPVSRATNQAGQAIGQEGFGPPRLSDVSEGDGDVDDEDDHTARAETVLDEEMFFRQRPSALEGYDDESSDEDGEREEEEKRNRNLAALLPRQPPILQQRSTPGLHKDKVLIKRGFGGYLNLLFGIMLMGIGAALLASAISPSEYPAFSIVSEGDSSVTRAFASFFAIAIVGFGMTLVLSFGERLTYTDSTKLVLVEDWVWGLYNYHAEKNIEMQNLRTSQDYNYKFAMFGAFISPNVPAYKETDPSRKSLLRTANNEANNNVNSKHAFDVKHVREGDEEW